MGKIAFVFAGHHAVHVPGDEVELSVVRPGGAEEAVRLVRLCHHSDRPAVSPQPGKVPGHRPGYAPYPSL